MRNRIWIPCAVALVVCVLLLLLKPTPHQRAGPSEQSTTLTNQPSQPAQPKTVEHRQVTNIAQIMSTFPPMTPLAEAVSKTNPEAAIMLRMWQARIDYYGKVVDENSNAVGGVKVHFRWGEVPAEDGMRTADTQSDSEGLFSLRGKRGEGLTVWFNKEGYYSSQGGQMSFNYAFGPDILSPDPQNPVVFKLHKKGQGVELITSENGAPLKVAVRVPRDNSPVWVDVFQKQASSSGQLEISQNKPPWREATEWSFKLSIPGGGLVENDDEFQFEAPESNYQPIVDYQFTKSDTNWVTQVTKSFYITFGEPRKYGWLRIESNLGQETVFLTYAINPSGSRNLEPFEPQPYHAPPPSWLPPGVKEVIPDFK